MVVVMVVVVVVVLRFVRFKKSSYTLSYYTKVKWGGFFYTFIFKAFCFLSFSLSLFLSFEYVRTSSEVLF